jgi:hypothetical protein
METEGSFPCRPSDQYLSDISVMIFSRSTLAEGPKSAVLKMTLYINTELKGSKVCGNNRKV